MDLDDSGSIDQNEFIVICAVSKSVRLVRRNIASFFDFVDMDGNHCIDLDEIDAALEVSICHHKNGEPKRQSFSHFLFFSSFCVCSIWEKTFCRKRSDSR